MVCIDNFWFSCYISSMLDKLKTIFNKKQKLEKTAKDMATEAGEPYIKVLDTNVDPENPKYGYFELDWNQHFVNNLKEHGFSGNTDEEVVDHWRVFSERFKHPWIERYPEWFEAMCDQAASVWLQD